MAFTVTHYARISFKQIGILVLICCFLSVARLQAQQAQVYKPTINRVLFVLDVSGSMKDQWNGKEKFQTAKELLYKLIDSVERKNPNVEFAIRALGYQSPRADRNCKDSKLLVPFAKNNAEKIRAALDKIRPQGMTPLAYSLSQAPNDFPADAKSLNSIILITDGNENCDGNPCDVSKKLFEKKISLRPFIVGIDAGEKFVEQLKCIGQVLDTKDETSLYNTVGVIIRQTLNTTTTQINLLDKSGNPTVTNIPFTLYDHATGKIEYNFVHTLDEKGNPDTLYLDPVGVYDLELHTYPSIRKENIELTPGKHNIIALDVPAGDLNVQCVAASMANNDAQVLLRQQKPERNILNVQEFNAEDKYLANDYTLEILTVPPVHIDTTVVGFTDNNLNIPNYGTLSLMAPESLLASIYRMKANSMEMVERFEILKTENHRLQPGEYRIVYKAKSSYDSETTKTQIFTIEEGRTVVLTL
ncbi:MAG: VWA domain-containing protein [Chitinophagales bacterium]